MTNVHHINGRNLLAHEIDDLLLQARGLVLVRGLLEERGLPHEEIDVYSVELERVQAQLVDTIRGAGEAA